MQIQLEGENVELTQDLKDYIQQKIGGLDKYLPDLDKKTDLVARVVLSRSTHHQSGNVFTCRVRLALPESFLKAEEKGQSAEAAVDVAADRLSREVRKYKSKSQSVARDRMRKFKKRLKESRLLR